MYSLKDDKGNRLPIDVALSKVAKENERTLRNSFDFVENPIDANSVFRKDKIYIMTSLARGRGQYSVIIKQAEESHDAAH